jgi:hypothetical protein
LRLKNLCKNLIILLNLGIGFEICEDKGEKSASKVVPSSNYHKEEEALKPTKTHYPSNPKPSFNPKRGVKKNTTHPSEEVYICMFLVVRVTWMSFAFDSREWRRGVWTVLETHIMMSLLTFHFFLVLHLIFLMDLIIAHMVFVHERVVLCLDALVLTHALIVVFIPHVGMAFPLQVSIVTSSRVALMVHAFPIIVHIPLTQMVRCKGL